MTKFAGKYEDPAALEKGVGDLLEETVGYRPPKIVGEGGMFADHAAAEKFYTTASGKITAAKGQPKVPEKPASKPDEPIVKLSLPSVEDDDDIDKILEKAGLDKETIKGKFLKNGALEEADYAALKKLNIGKSLANTIAKGYAATQYLEVRTGEEARARAETAAGGKEALEELKANAHKFLDADEIPIVQEQLAKAGTVVGAIKNLAARYAAFNASNGSPRIPGSSGGAGGRSPVSSRGDLREALKAASEGDTTTLQKMSFDELASLAKI